MFWKYVVDKSRNVPCVHVVFDNYFTEGSLKSQTRQRQGQQSSSYSAQTHLQPNMSIPDWKKVLSNSDSKREVTHLYTKHIALHAFEIVDSRKTIFVSGGFGLKTLKITHYCVSFVEELHSNQEEADTRLILHAEYCSLHGSNSVVVISPDTDVLVLLVHHFESLGLKQLFFKTGRKQRHCNQTRYVPVHEIVKMLSKEQQNILLTVYCLTGCDSCSAFYGIGEKTAFKVMMSCASDL